MFQLYGWLVFRLHFFQAIRFFLIAFPLFLCVQYRAFAVNIEEILVTENNGVYHISVSAEIAATEEHVRQVLTDYAHVYRLNYSVIESEVLESPVEGNVRVRTQLLCCTPIFCQQVERVDEISTLDSGDLLAVIVPEKSDFNSGRAMWKITSMGSKTRLTYLADIEPGFFIPPVLGTAMVINNMRKEFSSTFIRIEHIARINEEREWNEAYTFLPAADQIEGVPCNELVNVSLQ